MDLLAIGGSAFALAAVFTVIALRAFPQFISVESKQGLYRPGLDSSSRLPLVGGIAIIISVASSFGVAALLNREVPWPVLVVGLVFFGLGFGDDILKSPLIAGTGLSERSSMLLALAGSIIGSFVLVAGLDANEGSPFSLWHWVGSGTGGTVLMFLWVAALLLVVTVGTGISDGIDGLTPGLAVLAAGSMVAAAGVQQIGAPASSALTGACLGFLALNLPSNWTRGSESRRFAKAYLGDSGALAIGALLAGSAMAAGIDLILPVIVGVYLLDGFSSLFQAKIMVPMYRKLAFLGGSERASVHYSEFPLPFVATPLHHHLELIGMSRGRIAALLYGIGTALAVLAAIAVLVGTLVTAIVGYVIALLILGGLWFGSSIFRPAFFRLARTDGVSELELCAGHPEKFIGLQLSSVIGRKSVPTDKGSADIPPLLQKMNPITARRIFNDFSPNDDGIPIDSGAEPTC